MTEITQFRQPEASYLKAVSVSEKGATLDSCRHREGGDTSET